MAIYMFSYDLVGRTSEQHTEDSRAIKETVESLGAWCKFLSTTYLISSIYSLDQIQGRLTKHMTGKDRMIICRTSERPGGWLAEDEWDWIHKNL